MERHPIPMQTPTEAAHIPVSPKPFRKVRHFAAFLICCALFVAGFSITALWHEAGGKLWQGEEGAPPTEQTTLPPIQEGPPEPALPETVLIPEGATPIVTRDLSQLFRGDAYINNQTYLTPNIAELLALDLSTSPTKEPLVLVLHTHTSEGYLAEASPYIEGDLGEVTYTREEERNVLAAGRAFVQALEKKGITAIHCTVMHDDPTLSGSYERAAESIRFYREQYPSIRYVVDIHRDAILTTEGEYIRAATEAAGESIAQILPVVGSNAGGWEHNTWEGNLALSLQLRRELNQNGMAVCRPPMVKSATYNQEMAPFAILLEIGTGANSIDEILVAATLAGEAFAQLILPH